jgi:hypothetical protein
MLSLPILEHIDQHRRTRGTDIAVMHAQLRRVIVDFIADDVRTQLALGKQRHRCQSNR